MEDENINNESLPGDASNDNVESSDEEVSVSEQNMSGDTDVSQLTLNELEGVLGKKFPTKEAALKSIKDTYSYVGKKKDTIAKEVKDEAIDPNKFISREQYEQDMFYSKNPEFDSPEIKKVLESIAKSDGVSVREAANSDAFKSIFSAVSKVKQDEQTKSVLSTNPRLAASKNKLQEAQDARSAGNEDLARTLATQAVLESLEK